MAKQGDYNQGKWQVQRERCGIADKAPRPEMADAENIGNVVGAVMKRLGLREQQWMSSLIVDWHELVGEAVAKHSRPGSFRKDHLVVFVDNSVWLSELSRYGKAPLLLKLRNRFGAKTFKTLSFQLDPDGPVARKPAGSAIRSVRPQS